MGGPVAQILSAGETSSESAGVLLLRDLRQMFDEQGEQLTSEEIIRQLTEMESRPWGEWKGGKPISKIGLARLLRAFGIQPQKWREAARPCAATGGRILKRSSRAIWELSRHS